MAGEQSSIDVEQLTRQLDSFCAQERLSALRELKAMAEAGLIEVHPTRREVNLHCHTSFSYSAYGYSPSRFAWEAHRYGLEVAGVVDFDNLDGAEEFLSAGRLLGLKTVAGFETRVFVPEYRGVLTNSPNEPGVSYFITTGFTSRPATGEPGRAILDDMAERAQNRVRAMIGEINKFLDEVRIDYDEDVVPLTPAGKPTERHLMVAYERRAREVFPDQDDLCAFWSLRLNESPERVAPLLEDVPALKDLIRVKLMKGGGVGYMKPDEGSFPYLDSIVGMTLNCGALPSGGWLDGTSDGERDTNQLFSFYKQKGIPTVTIIPDRNWNIESPEEKALKLKKLDEAVGTAQSLRLPIIVGTEMNKYGQKFVDGFSRPELSPYTEEFVAGAHVAWGHTLLKMTAGIGYVGQWAEEHFGDDLQSKNEFFQRLGAAPYPDEDGWQRLAQTGLAAGPAAFESVLGL